MNRPTSRVRLVAIALVVLLAMSGVAGAADTFVTAGAGGSYETDSGLVVGTSVDHGVPEDPFTGSDTVVLADASFSASGTASLTVDKFTGTRTEISGIDATSNSIEVDPDDKSAVTISGGVTALSFENVALDGSTQLTYSANSAGTITVNGLPASTDFAAATPGGDVLTTGTTTASGSADINVDTATDEDIVLLEPSAPSLSNPSPDGGTTRYENQTLSVDVTDADFGTDAGDEITLEWTVDGSVAGTTTVTSSGTATFDVGPLPDGAHDWSVDMTDAYGMSASSGPHSWTIEHRPPVPDNNQASPSDGTQIVNRETNFSVPVSDVDFPDDGDTVTAEFYLDGTKFATKNVSTNTTVQATTTVATGGSHTWHVEFTDEYGLTSETDADESTSTAEPFEFSAPSELQIYNESAPTELLNNTDVTVEFYYENGTASNIVSRDADNGTVDFAGLPVDQSFIAVVDAPGYLPRRIYISSLIDAQSIYLLPETTTHVEKEFTVTDYSGRFPDENTVVIIRRGLAGKWRTVQGDYLGATGSVTAQLAYNERHRIVILNTETGEEVRKGEYTPLASGSEEIEISQAGDIDVTGISTQFAYQPSSGILPAVSSVPLTVQISQADSAVDTWSVDIIQIDSAGTETTLASTTQSGDTTSVSESINLSNAEESTLDVRISWTDMAGDDHTDSKTYQIQADFGNDITLISALAGVTSLLPDGDVGAFTTFLSVFVTAIATAAVTLHGEFGTEASGVTALGGLMFFGVIGWLSYQILFAAFAVFIATAGLRRVA